MMADVFEDGTSGGFFWTRWKSGDFKGQRLGQAFSNHFNLSKKEATADGELPDLFYEEDERLSKGRIIAILEGWQQP